MADIYVKSGGGTTGSGSYRGNWAASTTWALGDRVVATNATNYFVYECTTAGTGGGTQPTWTTTAGNTTVDGGATFTCRTPSTWANATIDMARATASDAAGDTIYVSQAHSESTAASVTMAFAGTAASPTRVICASDAAEPPTALATTASIAATGAINLMTSGVCAYLYGLKLACASGASAGALSTTSTTDARITYEACAFELNGTGSCRIDVFATNARGVVNWNNCTVKFAATAHGIQFRSGGIFRWGGGGIAAGGTSPTNLFLVSSGATVLARALLSGVDLSAGGASMSIFTAGSAAHNVLRNCKLPASWSGSLVSGTLTLGERHEMHNCDSGDTNYRLWIEDYAGSIKHETTIVRTGGASDGTTSLSRRMTSSANAKYPLITLDSPEITRWNDTVGSPVTVTVEVITDGVTLNNDEAWLEVQYLGTSGFPLSVFKSDAKADVLATAAAQDTSTATWTTTGLTTPVKQKLSVVLDPMPQEKGFIHAVVKLAKPSTTMYYCHKLEVT